MLKYSSSDRACRKILYLTGKQYPILATNSRVLDISIYGRLDYIDNETDALNVCTTRCIMKLMTTGLLVAASESR